jgi:hypothetical protein
VGFVTELDNGEGAIYIGADGTAEILKKTDATRQRGASSPATSQTRSA